ncbi:hypothetical protein CPB85DRAFT_1333529 [Mucidula mucida]|nr:hypothetical protein CPB85DRAFT_1333529 [Mucidula mucida]
MESSNLAEQSPLLFDLVECSVRLKCCKMVPAVYSKLCSRNWLQVIDTSRFGQTTSHTPVKVEQTSYCFLAAAFIEGLKVLRQLAPLTYVQALNYIRTPSNLLIITKLLILSDVERRRSLETLAPLITLDLWHPCLRELNRFLQQQEVAAGYAGQSSHLRHLYLEEPLHYEPYEKVVIALSDFTRHVHKHSEASIHTITRPRNKIYSLLCTVLPGHSISDDVVHNEHELEMA